MTLGPGGKYILPPLVQDSSPNQSSRLGNGILGIVMHVTQGSYGGAVSWFNNSKSQVSAHIVLREDGNEATQMVPFGKKAWHAMAANYHFIGIEMAGFYNRESDEQLHSAARIVAYLCKRYKIPPVWNVHHGGYGHPGICRHLDWGAAGGGHPLCPMTLADKWYYFIGAVQNEYRRGGFVPLTGPSAWGKDQ